MMSKNFGLMSTLWTRKIQKSRIISVWICHFFSLGFETCIETPERIVLEQPRRSPLVEHRHSLKLLPVTCWMRKVPQKPLRKDACEAEHYTKCKHIFFYSLQIKSIDSQNCDVFCRQGFLDRWWDDLIVSRLNCRTVILEKTCVSWSLVVRSFETHSSVPTCPV